MGLFQAAVRVLLEWARISASPLNPFGYPDEGNTQTPLAGSEPPSLPQTSASPFFEAGVTFHPDGSSAGFQCSYPKLSKSSWKACNTAGSRDCWLKHKGSDRVYDIKTDCEHRKHRERVISISDRQSTLQTRR